jgi:hypothetical protein
MYSSADQRCIQTVMLWNLYASDTNNKFVLSVVALPFVALPFVLQGLLRMYSIVDSRWIPTAE